MFERFLDWLKKAEYNYKEYCDLSHLSYIKIGAIARVTVYPDSVKKIVELIRAAIHFSLPYIVVGRMSNVLFKDTKYNGIIIKTDKITKKDEAESIFSAECGSRLLSIARELLERNLGGFEGLLGIPGSIGGMVRQNAGAFNYEISDRLVSALIYDTEKDICSVMTREQLNFGYRTSILCNKRFVLLKADFSALHKSKEQILEEIKLYADMRKKTQPIKECSLGSVFKRANGVGAGYYIDRLGMKGLKIGGASISSKHAGFIINDGGATPDDVLALIYIIKTAVLREFGITLEEEIEII